MSNILIKIDREEPIEFRSKDEANEYSDNIRASGRYYYKIYTKEYELETIFLKHLSSVCEEIMKSAATMEGVLIDVELDKDGEMTLMQKIICKLELEGLIKEGDNSLSTDFKTVHRLTKKGLSFWNDYKSLENMRIQKKIKARQGIREKLGIYNIR